MYPRWRSGDKDEERVGSVRRISSQMSSLLLLTNYFCPFSRPEVEMVEKVREEEEA